MRDALLLTVSYFFEVINFLIFVRVLLSWVHVSPHNKFVILLFQLTDPILEPFKKLSGRLGLNRGMVDFSPIIALIFLYYVARPLILALVRTFF